MIRSAKDAQPGVTLIEMLIVVAMISILVVAVGNTFFYVFQEQALVQEQLGIQQLANLAIESIALDAARAHSARIPASGQIVFEMPQNPPSPKEVKYLVESGKILRLSKGRKGTVCQVLAKDVKIFSPLLEGRLLRVRLALEKRKYRTTFSTDYKTAFAVKGEKLR